jgi:hypothetical protein
MTFTIDVIERLEELAAWHRMRAAHAGSDWIWEARVRIAEDLERRAADLRAQHHRRPAPRPTGRAGQLSPANSSTHARAFVSQA